MTDDQRAQRSELLRKKLAELSEWFDGFQFFAFNHDGSYWCQGQGNPLARERLVDRWLAQMEMQETGPEDPDLGPDVEA